MLEAVIGVEYVVPAMAIVIVAVVVVVVVALVVVMVSLSITLIPSMTLMTALAKQNAMKTDSWMELFKDTDGSPL